MYKTLDNQFLSVGAIEPEFYKNFLKGLSQSPQLKEQMNTSKWPELKEIFTREIGKKTLKEWEDIYKDLDACVAPVLDLTNAKNHPHHQTRQIFLSDTDIRPLRMQNDTDSRINLKQPKVGQHSIEILKEFGFPLEEIQDYLQQNVVSCPLPKSKL